MVGMNQRVCELVIFDKFEKTIISIRNPEIVKYLSVSPPAPKVKLMSPLRIAKRIRNW